MINYLSKLRETDRFKVIKDNYYLINCTSLYYNLNNSMLDFAIQQNPNDEGLTQICN